MSPPPMTNLRPMRYGGPLPERVQEIIRRLAAGRGSGLPPRRALPRRSGRPPDRGLPVPTPMHAPAETMVALQQMQMVM